MIRYFPQWVINKIWKPVLPLELIFFVTGRCNFRCKHCFIREFSPDSSADLSLEVITRLASDLPNLMVLMLTGGEPFLRSDLSEIVRIFSVKSHPKVISIATNGFLTDKIVHTVKQILKLPKFRSQLIVTLSFEGISQNHDTNRCSGAYQHAVATANQLKNLQTHHRNFVLGANITLLPGNERGILRTADELARMNLFSFLSQNIYREGKPKSICTSINLDVYHQLSQFVQVYSRSFIMSGNPIIGKWHLCKERYQAYCIERTCRTHTYQGIPCEAGRMIGVVYHDGGVAPCELLSSTWGNVNQHRFSEIWNSSVNREHSKRLRHTRCFCSHECFLSASLNLQLIPMLSCLTWNLFGRRRKDRREYC